jgi:hypothetical protein
MLNTVSGKCNVDVIRQHTSKFVSPTESEISTNGLVQAIVDATFQGISLQQMDVNFEGIYKDLLYKGLTKAHMQQIGPQAFPQGTDFEHYNTRMQDIDLKIIKESGSDVFQSKLVKQGITSLLSLPNSGQSNGDMSSIL